MRGFGVAVERLGPPDDRVWQIDGGGWSSPAQALYFGNAGTGCRLVMGAAAGRAISARFDGDLSLRSRPMGRILDPLAAMGALFTSQDAMLPCVLSAQALTAIDYRLPVPSAQIKSAILLAGLGAAGTTRIHELEPARDHTERMLGAFGVCLSVTPESGGGRRIELEGGQRLTPAEIIVPGDPSSAAFLIAAAVITEGSDIMVENVLTNALRTGFFETLKEMGADIAFLNAREVNGEPVADIRARYSRLCGVEVPPERAPSMIDEYPILSVVAAFAKGETVMRGLKELRVKESDRIASVEAGLAACGVDARSGADWLIVKGGEPRGGACVKTHHDHRIAMSFLVLGGASREPVTIDDAAMIATSFPDFIEMMTGIGANIG